MRDKLYAYIDALFEQAPCTRQAVDLKEEIRQNMTEKYEDLVAQGKTEQAAYNMTVASMGDIGELIASLRGNAPAPAPTAAPRRSALLIAIAVMLYILCVVPPIVMDDDAVGPALMFGMVAVATGLLIYNRMTTPKYHKQEDTMVEEFREWSDQNSRDSQTLRAISSALWALMLVLYFLISFATRAWYITWLVFPLTGAIQGIIKAIFDLRK